MTRREFTKKLWKLLAYAESLEYEVVLDWVKRDTQTQERLYSEGKSRCDGVNVVSGHQRSKAADVYIIEHGAISNDRSKYEKLHKFWETLGGNPMISWDMGHFE